MTVLDHQRVAHLTAAARRQVEDGRSPACQVALARHGELVGVETFGDATDHTRFTVFSCTKALVAAAVWALMSDRALKVDTPVAEVIPEFGANGKQAVTIEQLMLHTAGFPTAPMGPPSWYVRQARIERMAHWRLQWEPGTRYQYHPTSAHWVLAEILERIGGQDYRELIHRRVTEPHRLPKLLGIPAHDHHDIADVVIVDDAIRTGTVADMVDPRMPAEINPSVLLSYNDPLWRALGVPGAGGIATAADLALFYQALMHNPHAVWEPAVLADATGHVRCTLIDDTLGVCAQRSLGLMLAGTGATAAGRGFGRRNSPHTFGHGGLGGQIAWADPETGLSFAYLTAGLTTDLAGQTRQMSTMSDLAAECVR